MDRAALVAAIRAAPLGLMILSDDAGVEADLVPFLIDDEGAVLRAHIARANPALARLRERHEALVVFQGPDAYVSPSLYRSKAVHGRVVPTWNYVMVQARGRAVLREDADWISAQIADLTHQQESGRAAPWAVGDAPDDFIAAQMRAIVGVEIAIADLRGKAKLSQNRSDEDRRGVIDGLSRDSDPANWAMAREMQNRARRRNDK